MSQPASSNTRIIASPPFIPIYLPKAEWAAREAFIREGAQLGFNEYLLRAKVGSAPAQAVLGFLYLNRIVEDDAYLDEAERWSRQSAMQNDPYGQWVFAWVMFEKGNIDEGFRHLHMSAQSRFVPAMYDLGVSYGGCTVLPENLDVAYSLLREAAMGGSYKAKHALIELDIAGVRGKQRKILAILVRPLVKLGLTVTSLFSSMYSEHRLSYMRDALVRDKIRVNAGGEPISTDERAALLKLLRTFGVQ